MIAGFRSTLVKFLAFAAVALLLLLILYNTMAHGLGGNSRGYTAEFTNVSGLATGDDVRVAGVRVGEVRSIEVVPGGAEVGFALQDHQPLLANTRMVMRYQNLLGQRYLALEQPVRRGSELSAGATIPRSRTSPGFSLTALLNGFRPLFQTLRPSDVNRLAGEIVQVLQGEGGTVSDLLQETTRLTNFVGDRDRVIGQVLSNLTPVLQDMAGQGPELKSAVHQLGLLMTGLARNRRTIGTSISRLSHLMSSTSGLLARARHPVTVDTHLAREVAEALDQQKKLLGRALYAFGSAFGAIGRVMSFKGASNVYLCTMWIQLGKGELNLNGDLSRPQGGPWSKVCR
ncbi:MAG: MCE family protein [Marmoricola sp.]